MWQVAGDVDGAQCGNNEETRCPGMHRARPTMHVLLAVTSAWHLSGVRAAVPLTAARGDVCRDGDWRQVGGASLRRGPGCLAKSDSGLLVCDGYKQLRQIAVDSATGELLPPHTLMTGIGAIGSVTETAGGEILAIDAHAQSVLRVSNGRAVTIAGHRVSVNMPTADGPAAEATFKRPVAIAADADLNIFVADSVDHKIRLISRKSNTVSTLAGSGQAGLEDGTGSLARFSEPTALVLWQDKKLLVADAANHVIRAVDVSTGSVSILAGSPQGTRGWADGAAVSSKWDRPSELALHGDMLMVLMLLPASRLRMHYCPHCELTLARCHAHER